MNLRRASIYGVLTAMALPLLAVAPHGRALARVDPLAEPPAVSPEPTEAPVVPHGVASFPSPEIAARARAEFEANRSGKIDRSRYSAEMNARISASELADAAHALKALGAVKGFTQVRKITQGGLTVYVFRVECEKPPIVEEAIAWDAAGKVDFLQFGRAR